jgi:hypothetical protein
VVSNNFSDICDGCAKTGKPRWVEFCPNGVFLFQDGNALVAYPTKCGNGCSTLAAQRVYLFAIKRQLAFHRKFRERANGERRQRFASKDHLQSMRKQYWINRETDVCFDCEK